jgi:hypothetical protein
MINYEFRITDYGLRFIFLTTNVRRDERKEKRELVTGRVYLVTGRIIAIVGGGIKFKIKKEL